MVGCFAYGCSHNNVRNDCRFFRFPTDALVLAQWKKAVRRADREPTVSNVLCSCHFLDGKKENGPSIFSFNEEYTVPVKSPESKKDKMVLCAVVGCSRRNDRDTHLKFFRIPKARRNGSTVALTEKRRLAWTKVLKREDLTEGILKYERICSRHFVSGRPSKLNEPENVDWVPTRNLGYKIKGGKVKPAQTIHKHNKPGKILDTTPVGGASSESELSDGNVKKDQATSQIEDIRESEINEISVSSSSESSTESVKSLSKKRKYKLLEEVYKKLTQPDDEMEIYGKILASKLRRMDIDQRMIAEYLCNTVLYYGLKDMLQDTAYVSCA